MHIKKTSEQDEYLFVDGGIWLLTQCVLVGGYQYFRGTYHLHCQGEDTQKYVCTL
jgi:hypothetical protein